MAVRKSDSGGSKGSPSFSKSGYRSQGPVDTSAISKRDGVEDDGFDYEAAARKADESDDSDGYKYQVAVERARQIAGDDVSDDEMRQLVDNEFAKLSPTATGAQMRGEDNAAAQFVGGFNKAIDNVTGLVGDGINVLWDYGVGGIAGGLAGLAGFLTGNQDENWGQKAFDAVGSVVGEDGYIDGQDIANIGLDVLLGSVPGVGVPLVVGKNLVQNADNISEAVTGYDSVTGEELSGDARLANGLAAAANVGLSALPGIGRARSLAAADDVLSAGDDVAKALAAGGEAGEAASQATGRGARLLERLRPTPEKIRAGIKGGAQNALTAGGTALGSGGMGILNMAAAQDRGIGDVAGDYVSDVANGGPMNSTALQSILPVGVNLLTRGRARSMPGVTGRINPNVAPALRYAQMANAGRESGKAAQRMRDGGMSNDEIEEYLAMIGGGLDADAE